MSARYQVAISGTLLSAMLSGGARWPGGLRLDSSFTVAGEARTGEEPQDTTRLCGVHWCWVRDDSAPPELEGRCVSLTLSRLAGGGHCIERRVIR